MNDVKTIIPLIIAFSSSLFSIIAILKTHYDIFRPIYSCNDLSFKINQWESEGEKWYQLFLFLPIKIANASNSIGKIESFRIIFVYGKWLFFKDYEVIPVEWEVIPETDKDFSYKVKGKTLGKIIKNEWYPLIIKNKDIIETHLLFSSRWDKLLNVTNFKIYLQSKSNKRSWWKTIETWNGHLDKLFWSELIHKDNAVTFQRHFISKSNKDIKRGKEAHKKYQSEFSIPKIELPPSVSWNIEELSEILGELLSEVLRIDEMTDLNEKAKQFATNLKDNPREYLRQTKLILEEFIRRSNHVIQISKELREFIENIIETIEDVLD